jgi:putative zinc finger protein
MNCRDWEERIALHAERDLPPHEAAEAERHLAECAACRQFADGITQTLTELRAAHVERLATADFAAVRARVLAQITEQRRPVWRLAWIGAAAVALLLLTALPLKRQPEPPRTTSAPATEAAIPLPPAAEAPVPAPPPRRRMNRPRPLHKAVPPAEPLMVRLITNDPDVVIYWIAN